MYALLFENHHRISISVLACIIHSMRRNNYSRNTVSIDFTHESAVINRPVRLSRP